MNPNDNYQIARHCGERAIFWKDRGARLFGLAVALVLGAVAPAWAQGITERVSLGPGGVQSNGRSGFSAISADGQFVAFDSAATNLVPGDTNGVSDIFVHNRKTGITRRVSLGPGGVQGNNYSTNASISAGGRFVAFESYATNLVPGDTNSRSDVFVRDRQTGTTERVSLGSGGIQSNGSSVNASISADGRFVAFESVATNLVPGVTNGFSNVFVRDRKMGTIERVSLGTGGVQGNSESNLPAISADGRFVAFISDATNLVPGDTNGLIDVFVRDRKMGTIERVSLGTGGVQGNRYSSDPSISADGRFVAFDSYATNLVRGDTNGTADVFVRDRQTGTTAQVSLGPDGVEVYGFSGGPSISADGRFVAFQAGANLVSGDTNLSDDVFVRDRKTGTTRRVSLGPGGAQGNRDSYNPAISADGRFVAFESVATNLVPGDTNGADDVFVRIPVP